MHLEGACELRRPLGTKRGSPVFDARQRRLWDAARFRKLRLRHLLKFAGDSYCIARRERDAHAGHYVLG